MTIFCAICKRHVPIPEGLAGDEARSYFRSFGHDSRIPANGLRRGLVGAYARDFDTEPTHTPVVLGDPDGSGCAA